MIYFIGVGPGPLDLSTVKGLDLIELADLIIYPEPPINLQLLDYAKDGCEFFNSAGLSLEKVVVEMVTAAQKGKIVVPGCRKCSEWAATPRRFTPLSRGNGPWL